MENGEKESLVGSTPGFVKSHKSWIMKKEYEEKKNTLNAMEFEIHQMKKQKNKQLAWTKFNVFGI